MRLLDARLLKEDKALSKAKIVRVSKKDVEPTLRYIALASNIPFEDLHPVGTAGKADTSGDIDVAVDQNKHTPFKIHDRLVNHLGKEYGIFDNDTQTGSYAVPIRGTDGDRVQVDLMFTDNIEWSRFAYFSAGDKSEYKGSVRAVLLASVAAALDEKGVDAFHYDGEDLIVKVGRGIELGTGMKRFFQMRPHNKYTDGYTKGLKKVTPEEIKKMYPKLEFDGTDLIISDPSEVVKILFGPETRPSNVDSVEEIIDLIQRFPSKKAKKILDIAKIRARPLASKGIKLPPELT
ncbi:hypothetical protein LCGC14_2066450 [marine sediment metagenome]|uniref:Uncharacterized protein n=1 Tax=marine sediment metagenome TaxID=412755 RepID=A0A0F9EJV6_9ZZZZ